MLAFAPPAEALEAPWVPPNEPGVGISWYLREARYTVGAGQRLPAELRELLEGYQLLLLLQAQPHEWASLASGISDDEGL